MGEVWNSANRLSSEFIGLGCHPKILLLWQRDVRTSPLYETSHEFVAHGVLTKSLKRPPQIKSEWRVIVPVYKLFLWGERKRLFLWVTMKQANASPGCSKGWTSYPVDEYYRNLLDTVACVQTSPLKEIGDICSQARIQWIVLQSTPHNSNLPQGKSKKGSRFRKFQENSRE